MIHHLALALMLRGAAPSPTPLPTSSSPLRQFLGTWTCKAAGQSNVSVSFDENADGSIGERENWTNPTGITGEWDQVMTYDPSSATWTVKNTRSNGWVFTGISPGLNANALEFTGTQTEGVSAVVATRERFTFDKPTHFIHVWEQNTNNAWQQTGTADCTRDGTEIKKPHKHERRMNGS